jgi:hypothetical protein
MVFQKAIDSIPGQNWQHPDAALQKGWDYLRWSMLVFPLFGGVGALLAVIGLVLVWRNRFTEIITRNSNRGLGLLTIGMILAMCGSIDPPNALLGLFNFIPFFGLFAAYNVAIRSTVQLRQLAVIFVWGSIPVIALGLAQMFGGWSGEIKLPGIPIELIEVLPGGNPPGRMCSIFMYANAFAAYLQMVFILGLGLWVDGWEQPIKNYRYLGWLSLFLIVTSICIYGTSSRSVWMGSVLSIIAFGIYKHWYWILGIISSAIVLIFGSAYAPVGVREPLRSIVPRAVWARITDEMYPHRPMEITRTAQWQFAVQLIRERPLTGWGLQSFGPLYQKYAQTWLGYPHNLLLMLGSSVGMPVTCGFLVFVGWILYRGVLWIDRITDDRTLFFTYLLVFGGFMLFNITDVSAIDLRLNGLAWIVLASICGVFSAGKG